MTTRRTLHLRAVLAFCVLAAAWGLAARQGFNPLWPEAVTPMPMPSPVTQKDCPRLSSTLLQLASHPDPAVFATNSAMTMQSGRVRVWLRVATDADEQALSRRYRLVHVVRMRDVVSAWAPVELLCQLSAAPGVQWVGVPTRISPA